MKQTALRAPDERGKQYLMGEKSRKKKEIEREALIIYVNHKCKIKNPKDAREMAY